MDLPKNIRSQILAYQKNEITEHHIYLKLSRSTKSKDNKKIMQGIAAEELRHYEIWKTYTGRDVKPAMLKVWFYYLISILFGFTFALKLMEMGEEGAQRNYNFLQEFIPEAETIIREEFEHENALIQMLDEERLQYTGSMVLGLNDALVELTGALAGLTLALQNTRLIALTGLITGIAAALSMASSEYLSTKAEDTAKSPARAALYTGSTYIITVFILIFPYLVLENYFTSLGLTLCAAILIIAVFNYYIAVAKDLSFHKRFLEMAGLSLGVAGLSFCIGFIVRAVLGVEV